MRSKTPVPHRGIAAMADAIFILLTIACFVVIAYYATALDKV
ncbi:MAG: hypothetical protein ACOH1R_08155 [Luteimonas sp.]